MPQLELENCNFLLGYKKVSRGYCPQSENFWIFMSFRFYVKSILESLEVVKGPFFAILEALNFVD